jgi:hypothetical protein
MDKGDLEMLTKFCERYKVSPFVVFLLSFEYSKDDTHRYDMEQFFGSFCFQSREELVLHRIPSEVENYLIDVLAGRTHPKYKGKKL